VSVVRVLVVDDSVVARRVITDLVQAAGGLEVSGVAASASIALQKLGQSLPDVVVLDVEMPGMDGIEAVTRIRQSWPRLPVIMCSAFTERGAGITLRALAAGASDCVAKPSSLGVGNTLPAFGAELVAKIRALGGAASIAPPARQRAVPSVDRGAREPVAAIAIGCSTGGPNALAAVFASLPPDLSVPILVTQHMPPMFTRLLAERLATTSGFDVVEASEGGRVDPGHAYVAPGNHHMAVVRDRLSVKIALNQDPPENSCRPAIDVLFRSVAQVFGPGALAAVLTGMGHDGTRGAERIVEAGGVVIVQDAASCVVATMPSSVAAAVTVDGVYPIERVGPELVARVTRRLARGRAPGTGQVGRST